MGKYEKILMKKYYTRRNLKYLYFLQTKLSVSVRKKIVKLLCNIDCRAPIVIE